MSHVALKDKGTDSDVLWKTISCDVYSRRRVCWELSKWRKESGEGLETAKKDTVPGKRRGDEGRGNFNGEVSGNTGEQGHEHSARWWVTCARTGESNVQTNRREVGDADSSNQRSARRPPRG